MAIRIRMTRKGAKKHPFYRIIVADMRSPRDGRFIEQVGTYDPSLKENKVVMKEDKIRAWLAKGAIPSVTVKSFLKAKGIE